MMDARFDRLFVVTYGRSGSTLLQGLLNAVPGYRVHGENGGFLTRLEAAHAALADAHRHLADPAKDTSLNPWFGSSRYAPARLTADFRAFAERMLFGPDADPAVRVFGFKEIRYADLEPEALARLLAFMRELFPRCAFIFNSRALDDVVTSGWWRNNSPSSVRGRLTRFDAFAAAYAADHPDHAIHLTFDRLVDADRREVARLMDFLGEAPPAEGIEAVFTQNHSWANKSLTEYLMGRAAHVRLFEHDWWRAHVDEFRIDIRRRTRSSVVRGVFLPAIGQAIGGQSIGGGAPGRPTRLVLRTLAEDAEVVTEEPTPALAKLFPGNPASSAAGFRLELEDFDEAQMVAVGEGGERLVGRLRIER